jgi:Fic family protein
MPIYIHQLKDWPHFNWSKERLSKLKAEVQQQQLRLLGRMEGLGFKLQEEASLNTLTLDVLKSSEIEGEILNPDQVRSSIARRLGMDVVGLSPADRNVEGVVEMMLDATQNYKQALTEEKLFGWQAALFPSGRSGGQKIVVGTWRDNPPNHPMQVISGMMGREKVHFQAPESALLPDEMYAFLNWFNGSASEDIEPITKAAIAHLWFVTVHPFDDGNGRIARAIADLQLARADKTRHRFYSMSAQIRKERNKYYDILEETQKNSLDITPWMEWFYSCLNRALLATDETLGVVMQKARFWEKYAHHSFNDRQKTMLNKILDGYEGKITSFNWAKITGCSSDSAIRDINDLLQMDVLEKGPAGGRSTSYLLKEFGNAN